MKIELISEEEFNTIEKIYNDYPALTLNNKGYEHIDKSKFSEDEKCAFNMVAEILNHHIFGFHEFSNFRNCEGEIQIRFQYNYNYDNDHIPFTGVGYIFLSELKNGFKG